MENIDKYPNITMKKVEVNANHDIAKDAGIRTVPTFIVYKNGAKVDKSEDDTIYSLTQLLNRTAQWITIKKQINFISPKKAFLKIKI